MYSDKIKLDKFYTKSSVAKNCIKHIDISLYDEVIEPSAGSGAFSNLLKHNNLKAYDLDPEDSSIIKMNWFEYAPSNAAFTLVIGNPPFGKRNKLSKEFILKALTIPSVHTIAFILPDVYKKHTNQKIFPEGWRLKKVVALPRNSFTVEGENYHVPCSFFIFDKSPGKNLMFNINKYQSHPDFEWSTPASADIFIMGAGGKLKEVHEVTSTNRGYYLKATGITKKALINRLKQVDFTGHSSANGGVSWLSKPELIQAYLNI